MTIYENEVSELKKSGTDFEGWIRGPGDYDGRKGRQVICPWHTGRVGGYVTLFRTKRIYGSAGSTFSMAVAAIGNTELTVLKSK